MINTGGHEPVGRMSHPISRTLHDAATAPGIVHVRVAFPPPLCTWLDCPCAAVIRSQVELASGRFLGPVKPYYRCPIHWWDVARTFGAAGFAFQYTPNALTMIGGVN